jgi:hypothetical protein
LNTALISFKVRYSRSSATNFDIDCDFDIYVDKNKVMSHSLDDSIGFCMCTNKYAFPFIGRNYPLVSDVSSDWFGFYCNTGSKYWIQISTVSFFGNSPVSFHSWMSGLTLMSQFMFH